MYSIEAPREPLGDLADRDRARSGGGLKAGRDVDRVADHRVAVADLPGQDLARVDSDPEREVDTGDLLVDLVHRALHREAGAHRALGVVLVGDRRAEDGHDVVADELVDGAAEAGDLVAEAPERAIDHRLERLGVHPLGDGGVAGEVGEEHGRLAPLLGAGCQHREARGRAQAASRRCASPVPHSMQNFAPAGSRRRSWDSRWRSVLAARHAKASPVRVLRAAARALHPHVPEVTCCGAPEKVRSAHIGRRRALARASRHRLRGCELRERRH